MASVSLSTFSSIISSSSSSSPPTPSTSTSLLFASSSPSPSSTFTTAVTSTPSSTPSSTSPSTSTSTSPSTSPSTSTSTSPSTSPSTPSTSPSTSLSTSTHPSSTQTTPTFTSTPTFAPPPTTSASPSPSPQNFPPNTSSSTTFPIITTTPTNHPTPSVITTTSISTNTNGQLVTVTQILPNPTLSLDNSSTNSSSSFFRNTAAVAGVFVLVGLAVAFIILWIFLAIRSRRRTQRLDHDTAVAATLAAAGFHRTPLDDEDDPPETSRRSRYGSPDDFLHQRRSSSGLAMSSIPSAGRASAAFSLPFHDDNDPQNTNSYPDYIVPAGSREGYISGTPTTPFIARPYRNRSSSNTVGENITGHNPQHSGGSHEPLLSSYKRNSLPPSPTGVTPTPQRLSDAAKNPPTFSDKPLQSNAPWVTSAASSLSVYSSESTGDHRLDPNLRQRLQDDADSFRDLRDEEDYSRPVLGIRNLPDTASQTSVP